MAPVRFVQVSDPHWGSRADPALESHVRDLVARVEPEVIIVTGDLTHRNLAAQHDHVAEYLRSLGPELLVVPGNHDMPMLPPHRFTQTFDQFERVWQTTEPVYQSERLVVCGLNSARPWKQQGGALGKEQLRSAARVLGEAPDTAYRVVALHHHLMGAPWRTAKLPISDRSRVLKAFIEAGAELIVSGHVHQSMVGERREFELVPGRVAGTVLATAPGFGHPRSGRRGEARGLHVYTADEHALTVSTYALQGIDLHWIAERQFPRGLHEVSAESAHKNPASIPHG